MAPVGLFSVQIRAGQLRKTEAVLRAEETAWAEEKGLEPAWGHLGSTGHSEDPLEVLGRWGAEALELAETSEYNGHTHTWPKTQK